MAPHRDLIRVVVLASVVATSDHAKRQRQSKDIVERARAEDLLVVRIVVALAGAF